jgi:hypothetical protein
MSRGDQEPLPDADSHRHWVVLAFLRPFAPGAGKAQGRLQSQLSLQEISVGC